MTNQYVTPQGLTIPTVESLLDKLEADQRRDIDALLDDSPENPLGEINGIFASHLREAWEVLEIAYKGFDPDSAEGDLLESLSAITGTMRAGATASHFSGTRKVKVNLNAGTPLPKGTTFHVNGRPDIQFATTEEVTAAGAGVYEVAALCKRTGPIPCNAGTLTGITTPVAGLNSVTNDYDAELGTAVDSDLQLRTRRESELRATGSQAVAAVMAALYAITDPVTGAKPVLACSVFENTSDWPDDNGLPSHAMEALVFDGVAQDAPDNTIAQTIWNAKPGGIKFIGTTSGVATDSQGYSQTVRFSRPTIRDVQISVTLTVKPGTAYVGDTAAVAAIVAAFRANVRPGQPVRWAPLVKSLMSLSGVVDVDSITLQFPGVPNPAETNLTLRPREIGYTQGSFVTLTSHV